PYRTRSRQFIEDLAGVVPHLFRPCERIIDASPCRDRRPKRSRPAERRRRYELLVAVGAALLLEQSTAFRDASGSAQIRKRVKVREQIGRLQRIERRPAGSRLRTPH